MQKNSFIDKFRSKIVLRITGKNTERFIRKLSGNKIELISIKYPKRNIVDITIYKDDYEKVIKLKSIYEIDIVDASGLIKIKNVFKINRVLILFLTLGISLLLLLTNTIFKVEVVHTSSEVRTLLTNELKSYGMDMYTLKKNFREIEKVIKLKSIYEIDIVDASGLIKIKNVFKINRILILCLIVGISLLLLLTNTIFKVEVVHTSSEVRTLLTNELKSYGMDVYTLKKNFRKIEEIKKQILDKYPDKIEWLEIETVGVKYVVRVELREIINHEENNTTRNVVARKDALIKKVTAKNGMIIKGVNSYVKKGDVIISGNITLNEENKGVVDADGKVYGEVWYTTTVEYPFNYYEERLTGNSKNVISFKFLNKSFDLFSPFKNKKITSEVIIENKLLPIKLVKERQEELIIVDQVLTEEEVVDKAIELASNKMKNDLGEEEYIIDNKVLKVNIKENKVVLDVFFIIYEDITDYSEIVPEIIEEEE